MPVEYVFSPDAIPLERRSRSYQPKILMADFGDGFSQRASAGPNSNPATVELSFNNIDQPERDYIVSFLEARGGWQSFYYHSDRVESPQAYTCQTWNVQDIAPDIYSITATLKQVYDI